MLQRHSLLTQEIQAYAQAKAQGNGYDEDPLNQIKLILNNYIQSKIIEEKLYSSLVGNALDQNNKVVNHTWCFNTYIADDMLPVLKAISFFDNVLSETKKMPVLFQKVKVPLEAYVNELCKDLRESVMHHSQQRPQNAKYSKHFLIDIANVFKT